MRTGNPCNFGEVFATDGRIAANKLEIVPDNKNFFVNYNVAMTKRQDVFDKNRSSPTCSTRARPADDRDRARAHRAGRRER